MRIVAAGLAASLVAACGGGGADPDAGDPDAETCAVAEGDGVSFDPAAEPCRWLSSYRFFVDGPGQAPNDGVVPYDLTSPLFSDYSNKHRFIWLPEGTSIPYDAETTWQLPVGAVILKTFGYLDDMRDPALGETLIETRVLVHRADGWEGLVYQWNAEQTDARLLAGGATVPVSWIHGDGGERTLDYLIPNTNKCKNCHEIAETMQPIGPKARYLNRDFAYEGGLQNQIAHLADVGYLTGAPADPPLEAPRVPPFLDETEPLEARARGYLEINCAHCHNPEGAARTSGLDLRIAQTNPYMYGVCKPPVAAGPGSGGLQFAIVPGLPEESIIVFRMSSTEPDVRMPEIAHQVVHEEGVALISEWIASLTGTCETMP